MPISRWTRSGAVRFGWGPHAEAPLLVHSPQVRARLESLVQGFLTAKEKYHQHRLVWRQGLFVFGAGGSGKSAFTLAVARVLGWEHFTIPAHEVLDAHFFEAAVAAAVSHPHRVVVIEDIDLILTRVETPVFFSILDHAMERADGIFWVTTSRNPESTPKSQIVRPGRFDEAMRLELPTVELRRGFLSEVLSGAAAQFLADASPEGVSAWLAEISELSTGLSYSHLEEIRHLVFRLEVEGRTSELDSLLRDYLSDQVIAGDRFGGESPAAEDLARRVAQIDPRLLLASLDMTDVLKRVVEKSISDAVQNGDLQVSTT